ncbi:MliC family protein [Pseudomonas quasicaspiana]|uniref:MliC family protein n=1 Tax=Pseudomonas quasicaspiana TaxID=2829821 RepID=UPI001E6569C9|nr:MliC family protein [Pseudomonas quasicaspiana]MCD5972171.1 MliC family protein [Pseudomonas quasicaspiana]
MKGLIALATFAVLGGCASMKAPETGNTWTSWVCDSKAQVHWRYVDKAKAEVDVRLNESDQVFRLTAEPGSPSLYSNGVLAFQNKGDEGLVYWDATNDLIGRGCKKL